MNGQPSPRVDQPPVRSPGEEAPSKVASMRCAWCGGPIPPDARRDSICCSKRCRQARHRFLRAVGVATATARPLRLAYADPPYPGRSARYYRDHPDYAGEVDHAQLLTELSGYDGWALSTSADALQELLRLCPADVRVAAWHRGARSHKDAQGPISAWEPVIYYGGRPRLDRYLSRAAENDASPPATRDVPTGAVQGDVSSANQRVDSLVYPARSRRTDPGRVTGAKPATFCRWIFDLLGAQAGDQFRDLFPGSGGVTRAWMAFVGQPQSGIDAEQISRR